MNKSNWIKLIRQREASEPVRVPADAKLRLAMIEGVRAVVFDVYGTLISSGVGDISLATEQDRDQALKSTLIDNGFTLSSEAAGIALDKRLHAQIKLAQDKRRHEGIEYPEVEIREVWQDLIEALLDENLIRTKDIPDIDTLAIDYETRVNPTQAMPGLQDALSTLEERDMPMSIISNAQFYTPLLFDTFLGKDLAALGFSMSCSVWSYQQREGKPSKRLYEIAAEQLITHYGIQAHEALYVGNDIRNDIWPAQKVGFKTALFAGDDRSLRRRKDDANCADVLADIEITDLRQILDCI